MLSKPKKRLSSIFGSSHNGDHPAEEQPRPPSNSKHLSPVPPPAADRNRGPATLTKVRKQSQDRVPSAEHSAPSYPVLPPQQLANSDRPTITSIGALHEDGPLPPPPQVFVDSGVGNNGSSGSRPGSAYSNKSLPAIIAPSSVPDLPPPEKDSKARRKSWMPGGGAGGAKLEKQNKKGRAENRPMAWIAGHDQKLPYSMSLLLGAEKVPELWNEEGDTLIYLFPRTSGKGPSFRLDTSIYSASAIFTRLAHGRIYSSPSISARDQRVNTRQTSVGGSDNIYRQAVDPSHARHASLGAGNGISPTSYSSSDRQEFDSESTTSSKVSRTAYSELGNSHPQETHLYVPLTLSTDTADPSPGGSEPRLSSDDIENLISVRNLFAFLVGGPLVATEKRPTIFAIFMEISKMLHSWEFTNIDGSTFGEVADTSFTEYVDELNMADVRASREKTIDAIILGERMRSQALYVEGYVHAVGKYEDIIELKSPKFGLISAVTQSRLERAAMDLALREKNMNLRLQNFDFPSIFAGIMNSKTSSERKLVRFEAWRKSFITTKNYIQGYYKHKYGSWPPKASSKKNTLETSGLNRIVLTELYAEMAELYNLLVDRTNLTTRTLETAEQDESLDSEDQAATRALRLVLSEYDRSVPPVQPAVPFDIPLLPSLQSLRHHGATTTGDAKKDAKERARKLKDKELQAILQASHNPDAEKARSQSAFLSAFSELEYKAAHGKSIDDIIDLRVGQWLFMYVVLQSLPMLVVDAPGVKWSQGVEYFLCAVPRSGVPWSRDDTGVQRNWYGVAGSTGVVSLPADVVEHGVEGVYRRSHCWKMAEQWSKHSGILDAAVQEVMGASAEQPSYAHPDTLAGHQQQQTYHEQHSRVPSLPFSVPTASSRQSSAPSPSLTPTFPSNASLSSTLLPPPSLDTLSLSGGSPRMRSSSPGRRESAMMLGLEALPVPAGVSPAGTPAGSRKGSGAGPVPNTGKTFDDILGGMPEAPSGKKDKKKKK